MKPLAEALAMVVFIGFLVLLFAGPETVGSAIGKMIHSFNVEVNKP